MHYYGLNAMEILVESSSDEIEFVKKNSPIMVKSIDALRGWIDFIKKT